FAFKIKLLQHQFLPGYVVNDALILVNVTLNNKPGQFSSIHAGIIDQFTQKMSVGPAQSRLNLLRSHRVTGVGGYGRENFKLTHQASIKADQLKLIYTGLSSGLF